MAVNSDGLLNFDTSDKIYINSLELPPSIVAPDVFGKVKPQPSSVDVEMWLSSTALTAAVQDRLDSNTVHYGILSKSLRAQIDGDVDILGAFHALRKAVEDDTTVTDNSGNKSKLDFYQVRLNLPKASAYGEGVVLAGSKHTRTERNMTSITLVRLHVMTLIGVNAIERTAPQKLIVSCTFHTRWEAELASDRSLGLEKVHTIMQYERTLVKHIEATTFETLEALVEHICTNIRTDFKTSEHIHHITLRIEKPSAIAFAAAPVIEVTRSITQTTDIRKTEVEGRIGQELIWAIVAELSSPKQMLSRVSKTKSSLLLSSSIPLNCLSNPKAYPPEASDRLEIGPFASHTPQQLLPSVIASPLEELHEPNTMATIADKIKDALPINLKPSNGAADAGRHHGKSQSHVAFENTSTSVAASQMRNALNVLTDSVTDPNLKQRFETEMDNFFALFRRYLNDKAKGNEIDWNRIAPPKPEQVIDYNSLGNSENADFLSKLAVLKLNGGLGTSMGCVGPKSVIEVRDGMSFLDLAVRQIEYLNKTYNVNVPFVLMNSFNTDADTANIIKKYEGHNIDILTFNQSRYPRILKDSLLPAPKSANSQISDWYPPGHGDVFESLYNSGILDKLLERGVEILFLSNADNLGAVVDLNILHHMVETRAEYIMELTDKTKADVKGGTIIDYEGQARLLEIAQVPKQYVNEFKSIKKFKYFNTNNIWMNLRAVKRVVENNELSMEIIPNGKTIPADKKGEADISIIQLETAVGAAIRHFNNAHGVNVPRRRFLPVKTCSDLMLVKSDLYTLRHGQLVMDPNRFGPAPLIKLGNDFKKVSNFQSRIPSIPKILELDHLTITGAVNLGRNVIMKGTVIIVATEGSTIDIPPGSVLENVVVQGSLRLLEH